MIDFINTWVQGIIIAVIISTIIEMILPNGNIKKYITTVIGIYTVFIIVSPIVTKVVGKEINLKTYNLPEVKIQETVSIDTNKYIETTYINKMKQDVIKNIEEKGYKAENVQIDIEQEEANYGVLRSIKLNIVKGKDNTKIEEIKPVKIGIKDQEDQKQDISLEEISNLKTYLAATYGAKTVIINDL